jgi:uncharacterized protein (DUF2235 family)
MGLVGFLAWRGLPKPEYAFTTSDLKKQFDVYCRATQASREDADPNGANKRRSLEELRELSGAACDGLSDEDKNVLDSFRTVRIKFVGLFDTVRAAGLEIFRFHTLRLPKEVAAGEHREPWCFLSDARHSQGTLAFRYTRHLPSNVDQAFHALAVDEHRAVFPPRVWIVPKAGKKMTGTVEQRWFIGAHANVGGGYENDWLSLIPLQWMRDKAKAAGIHFKEPTKSQRRRIWNIVKRKL